MAMVPKYTSRASVPGSTGQKQVSLSLASSPLSGVGEGLTKVAGQLEAAAGRAKKLEEAVASRIQTREDSINSQRATELFLQNEDLESEKYIKDPNTDLLTTGSVKPYIEAVKQRVQQAVDSFALSPEARTNLFVKLSGKASIYTRDMLKKSITAQDDFSIGKAVEAARSVRSQFDTLPPTQDNITSEVNAATNAIIENSSNLSTPKQREIIKQQTEKVYVGAFDKVFASGDLDAAENLVNSGKFRKNVTEEQLRSSVSSIQAEKKERSAFLRDLKQKQAGFQFFAKRPMTAAEGENAAKKLVGITNADRPSEAERLVNSIAAREAEAAKTGEDLSGNRRHQLNLQRFAALTQNNKGGVVIQVGENGQLQAITTGGTPSAGNSLGRPNMSGGGLTSALNPSQAVASQKNRDNLKGNIDTINTLIGQIEIDPSTVGIKGMISSFFQKTIGMAKDLGGDFVSKEVIENFGIDPDAFFNPNLSEQEVVQNNLALELAKLRVQRGGGSMKAMAGPFKDAQKDVDLRGLTSSAAVIEKLKTIRAEFEAGLKSEESMVGIKPKVNYPEGTRARNPNTGKRIIVKNGAWVEE